MTSKKHNRRTFLSAATVGAAGGLLAKTVFPSSIAIESITSPASEYLFADGITYLNTGTLGPCRRETIDASMKAWEDLESQPVQFYGILGARELAEKTRTTAARFLGCDLSEFLVRLVSKLIHPSLPDSHLELFAGGCHVARLRFVALARLNPQLPRVWKKRALT